MTMNLEVPRIVRATDMGKRHDRDMLAVSMYQGPLDGSPDLYAKFDMWCAGQVYGILQKHFPGYPWKATCDMAQGMITISIPVIMGPTLNYGVRIQEWESMPTKGEQMIIQGGGQLLERFNLPRNGFEAASFLKARDNKHLAQIDFKKRSV